MPVQRSWDPRLLCACVLAAAAPLGAHTGWPAPDSPSPLLAELLGLLLGPCALAVTLIRFRRLAARAPEARPGGRRH